MARTRVIIMGAAGRDFHNFNTYFRDRPEYEVVAFTATQIPDIEGRTYPPVLAGPLYPQGIPIFPETDLPRLIEQFQVDEVVFAYSDVSHEYVMHRASLALACGADFRLLGGRHTMLQADRPVIAVCAVRTGCGKSQTTRRVTEILRRAGKRTVVVRHPMPYGRLEQQVWQRFATYDDLDRYGCTIEEREEYEPHLDRGVVVYAGVDYQEILRRAQQEADLLVWDGGNNDLPFFRPDLHIVVADPHRAGHELTYHPGEANLRLADVVVINKVDTADRKDVETVRANIVRVNPKAQIIEANSPVLVDDPEKIRGKRVLVIEDGPTLTHGEMTFGAGIVAARRFGAAEIVDPRPYVTGSIADTFRNYPHIGPLLPAMGYGERQIRDLERTIRAVPCDAVVVATPIDLGRLLDLDKPTVRVRYELEELSRPGLEEILAERILTKRS
ncbi:MAG: cyclic 2,3-diphosphoglycerate synthase [Chloroflexia bacterium]